MPRRAIYSVFDLWLKVGEPAQGSQSRHKAIFTPTRDDKPRESLKAPANRSLWNCEAAAPFVRSDNWILRVARPEENGVIYPLRLDELELPPEVRSDKREHQSPIGSVIFQDSFR